MKYKPLLLTHDLIEKMKIKDITFAINESQSVKNKEANKNKGTIRRKINYPKKNLVLMLQINVYQKTLKKVIN